MRAVDKLTKSEVLLKEAWADLEGGCYNKAVSASYFAVRLLVEHYIPINTSKDDKIANALKRRLERSVGSRAEDFRRRYLKLFQRRKIADHKPLLFSREEAEGIVREAADLIGELKRLLEGSE